MINEVEYHPNLITHGYIIINQEKILVIIITSTSNVDFISILFFSFSRNKLARKTCFWIIIAIILFIIVGAIIGIVLGLTLRMYGLFSAATGTYFFGIYANFLINSYTF
jgi:hypothetical protein